MCILQVLTLNDSSNKVKKERMRSDVWQFFTRLDSVRASCQICLKTYSHSGNTTNLFWHLKRKHQMELACSSIPSSKLILDNSSQSETVTPAKRRSAVWKYFIKEDAKSARCMICDKILSHSGNTSNLFSHINHKHKGIEPPESQSGESNSEEYPSEVLPDDSLNITADTSEEMLSLYTSAESNVMNQNSNSTFRKVQKSGVPYITKLIPKLEMSHMPVVVGEYDAVGINVSAKLRKMESNQSIFAEALVNRILLCGLLGNLTDQTDLYEKSHITGNILNHSSQG